jgi:hypothetical protein
MAGVPAETLCLWRQITQCKSLSGAAPQLLTCADASYVLKTSQFKTICPTQACTKPRMSLIPEPTLTTNTTKRHQAPPEAHGLTHPKGSVAEPHPRGLAAGVSRSGIMPSLSSYTRPPPPSHRPWPAPPAPPHPPPPPRQRTDYHHPHALPFGRRSCTYKQRGGATSRGCAHAGSTALELVRTSTRRRQRSTGTRRSCRRRRSGAPGLLLRQPVRQAAPRAL